MKFLYFAILMIISLPQCFSQDTKKTTPVVYRHGGGNGGDDLEIELKKRSLQIGYFLSSTVGKANFRMINPEAVIETVNKTEIEVTNEVVQDKYGNIRTCVNESERALITCNLVRISELMNNQKSDILTALLFHEILGSMGLELGYQENPSLYPISSKIIPFNLLVESTVITEASIRPEFYGLDNRSYGLTLINKTTGETLRLICLNDNVEVHRCKNFNIVRKLGQIQSPLISEVSVMSWQDISSLYVNKNSFKNPETDLIEEIDFGKKEVNFLNSLLNKNQDLSLIGTSEKVSSDCYDSIIDYVKKSFPSIERKKKRDAYLKTQEDLKLAKKLKEEEEEKKKKEHEFERRKDKLSLEQIGDFEIKQVREINFVTGSDNITFYKFFSIVSGSIYPGATYTCKIVLEYTNLTQDRTLSDLDLKWTPQLSFNVPYKDIKKVDFKLALKSSKANLTFLCYYPGNSTVSYSVSISSFREALSQYFELKVAPPVNL